jgi:hypothetical protein
MRLLLGDTTNRPLFENIAKKEFDIIETISIVEESEDDRTKLQIRVTASPRHRATAPSSSRLLEHLATFVGGDRNDPERKRMIPQSLPDSERPRDPALPRLGLGFAFRSFPERKIHPFVYPANLAINHYHSQSVTRLRAFSSTESSTVLAIFLFGFLLYMAQPCSIHAATPGETSLIYTVDGVVLTKKYYAKGGTSRHLFPSPQQYETNQFRTEVKGPQWYITVPWPNPIVRDSAVVSSDGTDVYAANYYFSRISSLENSTQNRTSYTAKDGKPPVNNLASAQVASGTVPIFPDIEVAGPIWLATASSFNLKNANRSKPPLTQLLGRRSLIASGERSPFLEWSYVSLLSNGPCLPQRVAYYLKDEKELKDYDSASDGWPVPFTNIIYNVTAISNINGFLVPLHAELSHFQFAIQDGMDATSASPLLIREYEITLTNFANTCQRQVFTPDLPEEGATVITEERFNNGTGVALAFLTTNRWPTRQAVEHSQAYKQASRAVDEANARQRPPKTSAILLLILVLVSGPMLFWAFRNSRMKA